MFGELFLFFKIPKSNPVKHIFVDPIDQNGLLSLRHFLSEFLGHVVRSLI